MQVFLPFPNISLSLKCLDKRRLGKQRVEAEQILNTLKKKELNPHSPVAWGNHPAVLMFAGYADFLCLYYNQSLEEFANRGGRNNLCKPIDLSNCEKILEPVWFNDPQFHLSHKSNLLRKALDDNNLQNRPKLLNILRSYGIITELVNPNLEYYWPVLRTTKKGD